MYRRDLLTAEIQRLGQALARIMGLKHQGKTQDAENGLEEIIANEFGILYNDLIASDSADFEAFLTDKNFPADKLDLFSQFLYLKFNPSIKNTATQSLAEKLQMIYSTLEVKHHIINMINLDRQKTIQQYIKS
jgi:hypothetical protein